MLKLINSTEQDRKMKLTLEQVFPDKDTNPLLIEMFEIINKRKKTNYKQIFPVSARPKDYIDVEKHHIIPKSISKSFGIEADNSKENLVMLKTIEHIQVHLILCKYYEDKNSELSRKQGNAAVMIRNMRLSLSTEEFSVLLRKYSIKCSQIYTDMAGTLFANNGVKNIRVRSEEDLPEGFVFGRKDADRGRVWIHNGDVEMRIKDLSEIPKGFVVGRKSGINDTEFHHSWGDMMQDHLWYNNGIDQIHIHKDQLPPEGYILGRLPDDKKWITNGKENKKVDFGVKPPKGWKEGLSSKGKVCVNNGIIWKRVLITEIPEGFTLGRLSSNTKGLVAMSNDITHHFVMVKPEEVQQYVSQGYVHGKHCSQWKREGYVRQHGYPEYKFYGKYIKK